MKAINFESIENTKAIFTFRANGVAIMKQGALEVTFKFKEGEDSKKVADILAINCDLKLNGAYIIKSLRENYVTNLVNKNLFEMVNPKVDLAALFA